MNRCYSSQQLANLWGQNGINPFYLEMLYLTTHSTHFIYGYVASLLPVRLYLFLCVYNQTIYTCYPVPGLHSYIVGFNNV